MLQRSGLLILVFSFINVKGNPMPNPYPQYPDQQDFRGYAPDQFNQMNPQQFNPQQNRQEQFMPQQQNFQPQRNRLDIQQYQGLPNSNPEQITQNNYNNQAEQPRPQADNEINPNGQNKTALAQSLWSRLSGLKFIKNTLASKFNGLCKKFTHAYDNSEDYMEKMYAEADKHKDEEAKKDKEEIEKCKNTSKSESEYEDCVQKYKHTKELFSKKNVRKYLSMAKHTLKPVYGIAEECANYKPESS